MARVSIESVTKRFGTVGVLENLDLVIEDGEFAVIVGPSGCGKSTLLRLIAGIDTVTAGAIRIGGDDVARVHPGRRDVAMVFQDYALYPHMSVSKNLSFGMRARRAGSKGQILDRVHEVATRLQIEHLLDRKPAQLSGGQRQRVALGRAMMRSPRVYLMDEPLSNLDAALRVQVREDLIRFHRDIGGTIVYVTHDQVEAMTMGERVIVMNDGVIQQTGAPTEIYDQPANLFVATFVGSPKMNILPAAIERTNDGCMLLAEDLRWTLSAETAIPDVTEVKVGFRPEAIVPAGSSKHANVASTRRRIELAEHIGHETLLRLEREGNSILARVPAHIGRETAEAVSHYEVAAADVHLFDASTGDALFHGGQPHSSTASSSAETHRQQPGTDPVAASRSVS